MSTSVKAAQRLGCACAFAFLLCAPLRATSGETYKEPMTLGDYLGIIAIRYDCYFTIELAAPADTFVELEFLANLPRGTGYGNTIDDCLASIGRDFPQYKIVQDVNNKAVFHLVDKDLKKIDNYCMDRTAAVRYQGKLRTFPSHLGPQVGDLREDSDCWVGIPIYYDYTSQISVDTAEKKVGVRSLLTDYLPLSRYSRMLWCAETRPERGGFVTEVHYSGGGDEGGKIEFLTYTRNEHWASLYELHPKKKEGVDPGTGTPMVNGVIPFTYGEIAYGNNPDPDKEKVSVNLVHDAVALIDERLHAHRPLQVRWAMLYLGKRKAEEGIPVLLKHLDYHYTTCGVLEESYPAVRALTQMGRPAADAALLELATQDESPLRLKLLRRLVGSVPGARLTRELLRSRLEQAKDEAEKQRLKRALEFCFEEND